MNEKKKEQLGMNPSTASGRLVKDILWDLLVKTNQDSCCKCNKPMTRETFSIEHLKPWLDSDDPVSLYFDLNNISFSHMSCNFSDIRRTTESRLNYYQKMTGVSSGTGKRILARHLITGDETILNGKLDIKSAGFEPSHVYAVCGSIRKSHKGHVFIYLD